MMQQHQPLLLQNKDKQQIGAQIDNLGPKNRTQRRRKIEKKMARRSKAQPRPNWTTEAKDRREWRLMTEAAAKNV